MASSYAENLLKRVVEESNANNWDDAVTEWEVSDAEEDSSASTSCICGKENIRYLYTIRNTENGHELFPIGSRCIQKFGQADLTQATTLYESLFKLRNALANHEFIELNSTYFNRRLLSYLDDEGVFKPTVYNHQDGHADYRFLLKMFNKRDKTAIFEKQQKKITAIIMNQIFPYLRDTLKDKKN